MISTSGIGATARSADDPPPPTSFGPGDAYAAIAILALFAAMIALTWHRWTLPLIDHGREMHVPARLLAGDRLYVDIVYYYGPIAPYVNAGLYYLFGVHLWVLHACGMGCAAWILAVIYWVSRQMLTATGAALATCLVLALCALTPYMGNYIQPYAFATLYGWTLAVTALACALRYVETARTEWLLTGSVLSGLALGCKPEMGALAIAPCGLAWMLTCYERRQWLWRPLFWTAIPVTALALSIYGFLVLTVPWQFLVTDTYNALSQPQVVYFSQGLSGRRLWPFTGYAILLSAFSCFAWCIVSLALAVVDRLVPDRPWGHRLVHIGGCALLGLATWTWRQSIEVVFDMVQPFRSTPLVAGAAFVYSCWQLAVGARPGQPASRVTKTMFILSAFSLAAVTRVFLNVSVRTPYGPFTVPPSIVLYTYLFLEAWPSLFTLQPRAGLKRTTTALVGTFVIAIAVAGVVYARTTNTEEIRTDRGTLLLDPQFAGPLKEAIRFVAARTAPGDVVVTLPEGSFINFMADRPYAIKEENILPGYLPSERERDMIGLISARQVPLILLLNRLTPEYRDAAFGIDYNQDLVRWIETHYRLVATFGRQADELRFGDERFFVRAYERMQGPSPDGRDRAETRPSP